MKTILKVIPTDKVERAIASDLTEEDKPMKELLDEPEDDKSDKKNNQEDST